MRKAMVVMALAALLGAGVAYGIAGTPDHVPAATLLVPFFEVGIDSATHVENTLLVVHNVYMASVNVHYQVWDIDGEPVFNGNLSLGSLESWSTSMYDLIALQTAGVKAALTQGAFYRGFVTFDVVTAATALTPQDLAYPFGTANYLEGYIYYVRLQEGSANGISMVPIEYVGTTGDNFLHGFYQWEVPDGREEIDVDARTCAAQLVGEVACDGDASHTVYRVKTRTFGSVPLTGSSRLVVFAWTVHETGGPSALCVTAGCATEYTYRRYDETGAQLADTTVTLPHVVNLFTVADEVAGWASMWEIPSVYNDTQIYAFSFNSAAPAGDPYLTWDAIFEGFITP